MVVSFAWLSEARGEGCGEVRDTPNSDAAMLACRDAAACYPLVAFARKMELRIEDADRIILTLTEDHNNTPNYVRGFELAQAYFAKYHDGEAGK